MCVLDMVNWWELSWIKQAGTYYQMMPPAVITARVPLYRKTRYQNLRILIALSAGPD